MDVARLRVLLADEDAAPRRALALIFAREGFSTEEVEDATAARSALGRSKFDCIVAAHLLPDGPGTDLVADALGTPVIIVGSLPDAHVTEHVLAFGAEDFLSSTDADARSWGRAIRFAVGRRAAQVRRDHRHYDTVRGAVDQLAAYLAHGINNPATVITHNLGFLQAAVDQAAALVSELHALSECGRAPVSTVALRRALDRHDADRLCTELRAMVDDTTYGMSRIIELVKQIQAFHQRPLNPEAAAHVERFAHAMMAPPAASDEFPVGADLEPMEAIDSSITTLDLVSPTSTFEDDEDGPSDGRALRILAVDDEALILSSYRRMLRRHQVTLVQGGQEALDTIREDRNFDGILCDLMMPEVGGPEFHRALEQLAPELVPRVAYCTGGTFTEGMQSFVRSLANPVLDKPIRPQEILTLTERWAGMTRLSVDG